MASLYARVMQLDDYDTDGGPIDSQDVWSQMVLFEASLTTAANIKTRYSCTTGQAADVDALLATMPAVGALSVLGIGVLAPSALPRARWTDRIFHVLRLGVQADPMFDTVAKVKAALGV